VKTCGLRYYRANRQKGRSMNLYYAIVGDTTDTNMGLARFMGVIVVFIVLGGGLSWLIG
jgi:hypothetical protein